MQILDGPHYDLNSEKRLAPASLLIIMVLQLIDTCLKIVPIVTVAEFLRRIYLIFREHNWYQNHYEPEQRFLTISLRALSINNGTVVILCVFVVGILVRFAMTKEFVVPPIQWYTFVVLYWIYVACAVSHSGISNAEWIRQPYGIDYASGMASNYFHGYLKLTLPSHTGHLGIKERIAMYEDQQHVQFALKRLVILIPNTMFVNAQIKSKYLTKEGVEPLHVIYKNRAGVERPFKNDIYKITKPIDGTFYYVAMEGATPMLSFFEAMNFYPSTTNEIKEMKREILLKFYKHLNKLLKGWPETEDEAELILYNAHKADGSVQDVGEVILSHITNMWKEGRS